MKLLAENNTSFTSSIDQAHRPESSIVCRYRNAVQLDDRQDNDLLLKQYLLDTSISEGARIVPLMTYKDVELHILDETSRMATRSLKSIDGCLAAAFCRLEGNKRVVFESGGNTGSALTRYGQNAGMETFFFFPLDNLDLLDSRLFQDRKAHLVGVGNRGQVKEFTGLFAKTTGIRHIPDKSWRNASAMFRGLFILEHLLTVQKYDWLTQSVSAAFGPIGIYHVLQTFAAELGSLPRFLGIQQEANCPMFEAWKPNARKKDDRQQEEKLLTRVMYDETPQTYKTYDELQQLLRMAQGDLLTVNEEEFYSRLRPSGEYDQILELLRSQNIAISLRSDDIIEKTGMIALVGTLKAIDAGKIKAGSRVLCCLTSGVSDADGQAQPEKIMRAAQDVLQYAETIPGEK
ncbi:hypothetical protein ACFLYW_00170 [Thermodesulfobacteriota bacterium]